MADSLVLARSGSKLSLGNLDPSPNQLLPSYANNPDSHALDHLGFCTK